jgi:hypothetical protein
MGVAIVIAASQLAGCDRVLGIPERTLDPHATCDKGVCTCSGGFADCDGDPSTGCEADLSSNPAHCGVCTHDCLGGACGAGVCQPVTLTVDALDFDVAAHTAYVAICHPGSVQPIGVYAAGATTGTRLVLDDTSCGLGVGVQGSTVYWRGATLENGNVFFSADVGQPGNEMQVAVLPDTLDLPAVLEPLAVGVGSAYFTNTDGLDGLSVVSLASGSSQVVTSDPLWTMIWYGGSAYWGEQSGGIFTVADGATMPTTIDAKAKATSLAVDATRIYYGNDTAIASMPRTGGASTQLGGNGTPIALAVDATTLYWMDQLTGLWAAGLDGSSPRLVFSTNTFSLPAKLRVDDAAIYWLAGRNLSRLAR